jgi:stage V sporulation protein SpoVS
MADNVAITAGSGTAIAADDISSVFYQRVKVSWGVDGSAVDASASNPFPVTVSNSNTNGQTTMANSAPVVIASNQTAVPVSNGQTEYETVAASQTNQTIGATGASGDYLAGVLVIPATTSPGNIQIKDGSNTAITVFTGGASSVSNLVPFFIPLGIRSAVGAWQITTGANVSAIGVGDFT